MVFDVVVLVIVLISASISFLRGFIREVLTILGVVGGMAAAYYGGPILVPYFENWLGVDKTAEEQQKLMDLVPYDMLAEILAYGSIFIVVALVLSIVSHILAETARAIGLGPIDRTLGVIFGIGRGILLIAIPFVLVQVITTEEQRGEWFKGSKTYFYIDTTATALAGMLPDETMEKFKKDAEAVKEGSDTREKLQSIDLLKTKGAPKEEDMPAAEGGSPGYTEEFREEMDQLFQNKPGEQPQAPPPAEGTPQR